MTDEREIEARLGILNGCGYLHVFDKTKVKLFNVYDVMYTCVLMLSCLVRLTLLQLGLYA